MTNINVVNTDKAIDLIKECLHSAGPDTIGDVSNTVVNIRNLLDALEQQTRRLSSSVEQAHRERDFCLLYTSPSPRDRTRSRMPSSA